MPDSRVTEIQQRGDDTIVVYVQTDGFYPGQEVEVSVYLTQGDAYIAYNDKKRIPLPDPASPKGPAVLHVELSKKGLDGSQPVTVVTRVAEVWPSVLHPDPARLAQYEGILGPATDQAITAVWTYQDAAGKGLGDLSSPS